MSHPEPRWKRQPDERPEQILQAAVDVFADKGFRAATMDEIAAAAGITKGTIYLYFPSKEELFVAMARRQFQHALDLMPEPRLNEGDDIEAIAREVVMRYLRALMEPQVARVFPLIVAEFNHIPALQTLYREDVLPKVNFQLAAMLQLGMDMGVVRRLDPVIAARSLMGMVFVFVMTQEVFGAKEVTPMDTEAIAETVVSIFFHGILERKEIP